ncbi:MAG: hypothetical protein RL701_6811 [Pseudomonadota bacterium]
MYAGSLMVLALGANSAAARAEDKPTGDAVHYHFEDEDLFGELRRPDGELLHGRTRRAREPLIRPRLDFLNELYKAVERL